MSSVGTKQFSTTGQEEESSSRVSPATYLRYFQSGGVCSFILFALTSLTLEIFFCASDYWLNLWTAEEIARKKSNATNAIASTAFINETEKNATFNQEPDTLFGEKWVLDRNLYIYVYSILIGGVFIFAILRVTQFCRISPTPQRNTYLYIQAFMPCRNNKPSPNPFGRGSKNRPICIT